KAVLENLITGRAAIADAERKVERPAAARPGAAAPTAAPAIAVAGPPSEAIEQEITIVADPSTYSLVVYASKKNHQWISSIIRELDKYRPQVLLDCILVEVWRDDAFQSQVDVIAKLGSFSSGTSLERLNTAGFGAGEFSSESTTELTSIGGTGKIFFGDKHVQTLIEVMERKRFGRVMSRPQLLVKDNEEGTIRSEDIVYVPIQRTTFVQTAGEGSIVVTPISEVNFEAYPAGVTLTITPHISKGDNVRLNILLERKDNEEAQKVTLPDGTEATAPPDQTSNTVTSVVTVPNNSTIILGGLETINQARGGTKVPILGDLPLVGGLFRTTDNIDDQRKLYVFIRAHILRPGEDAGASAARRVSRPRIESFEQMEGEMQQYQDWPGLGTQPMQPERVLDEQ
ncbi:MAG TPA: hypothetical protein VLH60_06840, partial [Sedimentisphaerales bacterium]|nr:hypothetical protein [Sedimentisphaerales bacterium]